MKIREKLFRWMCPEVANVLEQAESIVRTYKQAKDDLTVKGKDVRVVGKGIVFLGDVAASTIKVTPKLYTEVNLSKFELDALVHVSGDHQSISESSFDGHKGREKKNKPKVTGIITGGER
jgi:hypothetical protein